MANEDAIPLLSMQDCKEDEQHPQDTPSSQRSYSPVRSQSPVHHMTTPMQYPQMGASQQMSNNSTVVMSGQPTSHLLPVTVVQRSKKPSQGILIFSLVLVSVCSLICNIPSLFLLIPGVIFAVVGFNYSHSKDPAKRQTGRGCNGVSLCCSVTVLVSFVVTLLCIILFFSIFYGTLSSHYSNSVYNHPWYYPYCSPSCYDTCIQYDYDYYTTGASCSSSCYCYN